MATCPKCRESKPDSEFYANRRTCKECDKASAAERYRRRQASEGKIVRTQQRPAPVTCKTCAEPVTGKRLPQGLAQCQRCRMSEWAAERVCPDCGGAKSRRSRRCADCGHKARRVLSADDPRVSRRIRERAAPGIARVERYRLLATWRRQGRACIYCGDVATTIDHVVPLIRGGSNSEGNLAPACATCNFSKGPRLLVEMRAGRAPRPNASPIAWEVRKVERMPRPKHKGNVCPECGEICAGKYCSGRCGSRYLTRRAYRAKVGLPLDAKPYANRRSLAA